MNTLIKKIVLSNLMNLQPKNIRHFIFFIVFLSLGNFTAYSQVDSCFIRLKNSIVEYDRGDFDASIQSLKLAFDHCDLNKTEKVNSYKLMILNFIRINQMEEAEKVAAVLMKLDPYYQPDKFRDDPRLSALFEKYKPMPAFRVGFNFGFNRTSPKAQQTYSIVHDDQASGLGEYSSKTGFQLGLSTEYLIYKNLWLQLDGRFRRSVYAHNLFNIENTTVFYSENLSCFDVPLSAKYYFLDRSISPYIEAGANFSFLSSALSTTERDDQKDIVNRTEYRNSFMTGSLLGAGVCYNNKALSYHAGFRLNIFGQNVNKEGTRYDDNVNIFKYYYIDDDFTLNNWMMNIGVNYSFIYKNKKV